MWRYYKIGVVNMVFGLGLYSLLVFAGVNLFIAQIVAHVAGVIFNYFMFTRHVFQKTKPSKLRFGLSYVLNYGLGLAILAGFHMVITSPYVAGFLTTVCLSLINYIMLKVFVFIAPRDAGG